MKRFVTLLCVLVMVFGTVSTVLAQPSVSVNGVVTIIGAVDKDGNEININFRDISDENKAIVLDALKEDALKELLGDDYNKFIKVIQQSEAYVWDSEKGEITGKKADKLFPATITLDVLGVNRDSVVYLLQYVDGKWSKVLGVVRDDGTVEAAVKGVGPTVILVDNSGVETTTGGNSEIISPQTGVEHTVIMFGWVAFIALIGAVVAAKKSRA